MQYGLRKGFNMYGCRNCKYLTQYQSLDYYEPNDTDCSAGEYSIDTWCDGKEWCDGEFPLCDKYEYDYRKEWY